MMRKKFCPLIFSRVRMAANTSGLYGYSMAIGVVIFLFSFALSACVNRATSREPLEF